MVCLYNCMSTAFISDAGWIAIRIKIEMTAVDKHQKQQ